jgi:protein gp37
VSAKTGISWTDATWNPVVGCEKVSQGCKFCYAKTLHDMRHKAVLAGKGLPAQYAEPFERVQLMPDRLGMPLSWRNPRRVFVNSVSDLFHKDVPFSFVDRVVATMAQASRHTFQILTKRPERMQEYSAGLAALSRQARGVRIARSMYADSPVLRHIKDDTPGGCDWPLSNVWLGVSVENQTAADERIPLLLQTPAAVRFLSCEPLLGAVNLNGFVSLNRKCLNGAGLTPSLDWVIVGGESGQRKQDVRPMHPDWARSLRDQCAATRVPFHFKQWGDYTTTFDRDVDDPDWRRCDRASALTPGGNWLNLAGGQGFHGERVVRVDRVGTKRAGRVLDGRTWNEFPALPSLDAQGGKP